MPVKNPAKANTKGRTTPYIGNKEPSTPRGKRRSAHTEEYQDNVVKRKQQTYGHRVRGKGGANVGPFKGPSKRPGGKSQKEWQAYMCGQSKSL